MKKIIGWLMICFLLVGCQSMEKSSEPIHSSTFMLGTVISVTIYDKTDEAIIEAVFDRMQEIEEKMSGTLSASEVNRININFENHGLDEPIIIDEDVYEVISSAVHYGRLSEGRFDITMAPIVKAWGIGSESQGIPSDEKLEELLKYVGLDKISITNDGQLALAQNTTIDLGGIAKGYAADEAAKILENYDVKKAIINLGGNVKVIGEKEKNVSFKIGIQDPLAVRNDFLGILDITDKTVVTSGDYEKYFEQDGIRYHHIFDPATGYPYQTNVASVTVIGNQSIIADAMSTVLYLMDVDEGIEFVNDLEGIDCIYVTRDKNVYISNGSIREAFELTNKEYQLVEGVSR